MALGLGAVVGGDAEDVGAASRPVGMSIRSTFERLPSLPINRALPSNVVVIDSPCFWAGVAARATTSYESGSTISTET